MRLSYELRAQQRWAAVFTWATWRGRVISDRVISVHGFKGKERGTRVRV